MLLRALETIEDEREALLQRFLLGRTLARSRPPWGRASARRAAPSRGALARVGDLLASDDA